MSSGLNRAGCHDPKLTGAKLSRRNADDVEPIAVFKLDALIRVADNLAHDSIQEDLVRQIRASFVTAVGVSAIERHSFRSPIVSDAVER